MPMRSMLAVISLLACCLVFIACGSSGKAVAVKTVTVLEVPHGGAGVVSQDGSVGSLRLDRSTRSDVQAFAGSPDYVGAGRIAPLMHQFPDFLALGYDCHASAYGIPTLKLDPSTGDTLPSHTDCQTVFYINQKTGKLAAFLTAAPAFRTTAGVRPGTTVKLSKAKESKATLLGNPPGLELQTQAASLALIDATVNLPQGGYRVGRTIAYIEIESRRHPIGLEFV